MTEVQQRHFLPSGEIPGGFIYPQSYFDFIKLNPPLSVAMTGMPPWIFAGDCVWAKNESKELFGVQLVPFAQAEGMDMIAYFEVANQLEPKVWVADPWELKPEFRVYKIFNSFGEWLIYARNVSQNFLEENPHFTNNQFWFPN